MPVTFNIRHLDEKSLFLEGELPFAELDLGNVDELIHLSHPLCYDLSVEKFERGILVQGKLRLALDCECARCLRGFPHLLILDPWACHLAVSAVAKSSVSELTAVPYMLATAGTVTAELPCTSTAIIEALSAVVHE